MVERYRGNYALLEVLEHLGPDEDSLAVEWATFAGNRTATYDFSIPATDVVDAYLEIQAYDVGSFGHEIVVNDAPLSGFDLPPADGWQYWMDSFSDRRLQAGENSIQIRRDTTTDDAFAIGNVVVNWREPLA